MDIDTNALQRLLDKEAIREASLRYTRGIDRHDDELMASAYHVGAKDDHGEYIGDAAGFIPYAHKVHETNWDIHQHFVTNQTIELDGDIAHVETYFLAALRRKDGPIDLVGGRYADRFEKREGRWAVAERACLIEFSGELPAAKMAVPPDLFLHGTWDRTDISYQRPLKTGRPPRQPA